MSVMLSSGKVIIGEIKDGRWDDNKLELKVMWSVALVSMIYLEECVVEERKQLELHAKLAICDTDWFTLFD